MSLSQIADVEFPWDSLEKYKSIANNFSTLTGKEIINVSIGTPIDPVPEIIQEALANATNAPGYPLTVGTSELRFAIVRWMKEVRHVSGLTGANIVPTLGSKEAVALLPLMLGLGDGDVVVRPKFAYPTYDIGATACGATVLATDDVNEWKGNANVKLVWLNFPNNPTGQCVDSGQMKAVVDAAREIGAVVASDECYALFDWRSRAAHPSILDPHVCGSLLDGAPDLRGVLMLYSLSKQVNLAGYRAAFIAGDANLVKRLQQIRKQCGFILPGPIQAAMTVALDVEEGSLAKQASDQQVAAYRRRHAILKQGLIDAGYDVEHSNGSLYVWVKTKTENCWSELEQFAKVGILAAPGVFYDESAINFLRISTTATDSQIEELVLRLAGLQ
jgi:succinyldiaminopimelate transaminase